MPFSSFKGQSMPVCFWLGSITHFHILVSIFQNKWHCTITEIDSSSEKQSRSEPKKHRRIKERRACITVFLFYSVCVLTMLFRGQAFMSSSVFLRGTQSSKFTRLQTRLCCWNPACEAWKGNWALEVRNPGRFRALTFPFRVRQSSV